MASVTGLTTEEKETDLAIRQFVPEKGDPMGLARAIEVFENKQYEPDLIYATGDPGSIGAIMQVVPADTAFLAYVPIEGEPMVNATWRGSLDAINFFTCSNYGVDVVQQSIGKTVDMVYHGVDTDVFSPLTKDERDAYRERLGWEGKFVVVCVAQNVRRKQWPRLLEAIAVLKHQYNQKDILLYAHTVPFQGHWLEGHHLPEVAAAFGLTNEVVFNPMMKGFGAGVPERGDLDMPGLRELVGSADLFVLPSQVEGFGLPIAEAMACGTPVAVTKYGAGWEVANLGGGTGIQIRDWEVHKSGTRYANLDPQEIAKTILALKRSPSKLARMREQGLRAVNQFDWAVFEEYVVAKAQEVYSRHEAGTTDQTASNQGREEAGA